MDKTLSDRILASGALSRIPSEGSKNRFYEFEEENVLAIKDSSNNTIYITDLENSDEIRNRTWHADGSRNYPRAHVKWCLETAHINLSRLIMSDDNDMFKAGNYIDHRNGNINDNRRCNLRICSSQQNAANRLSKNKCNVKKISDDKYKAQILVGNRMYSITSDTREEAEQFILDKKEKFQGEYMVEKRIDDGVYDKICNRIKSAEPAIHFNDPRLEKRYNFTNGN